MGNNVFGVNMRKRKRRAPKDGLGPNWFFCPVTCHEAVSDSVDCSMLEA